MSTMRVIVRRKSILEFARVAAPIREYARRAVVTVSVGFLINTLLCPAFRRSEDRETHYYYYAISIT